MYVYRILNIINNKVYIGLTTQNNPKQRFYRHLSDAKYGVNSYFYNSIRKYGRESFKFEIIEICSNIDELNYLEKYYIKFYESTNKKYGYNVNTGGNYFIMPEETKEKISKIRKLQYKNGYKNPPRNVPMKKYKPKKNSFEYKLKISLIKKAYYSKHNNILSKPVKCLNDGKCFESASKASRYYNLPITAAARVCNGGRKAYKGLVFQYI